MGVLKTNLSRFWNGVLELGLVLWIARVSVVSTLIGAVLFAYVPQVHDTFLEVRTSNVWDPGNIAFWSGFLLSAVFFWALPVHYAARLGLHYDPSCKEIAQGTAATLLPRALAVICLLSIAIGAYYAQSGLLSPPDSAFYEEASLQTQVIMIAALVLAALVLAYLIWRRALFPILSIVIGMTLMFLLLVIFCLLFVADPQFVTHTLLLRAPLLPLLLGVWLPILGLLAVVGRHVHAPFILLLFIGLEGMAYFLGDNHDVRRLWIDGEGAVAAEAPTGNPFKRETITEAIARWQVANDCADAPGKCPRPIIIAASGGASRAGFFTAGVLGELMDQSIQTTDNSPSPFHGPEDFRNRLFAISTVSGSSTGAAFFIAALRYWDQQKAKLSPQERNKPPCKKDAEGLVYFEQEPTSWRQCMEQFLAGDFVSPTLYGLVYKDAIRGVAYIAALFGKDMRDRAEILEHAWEDRFCLSITGKVCEEDDETGMRAPFLSKSGRGSPQQGQEWTPILLLNATDAQTGRRVVISPLTPKNGQHKRLFPDAYDLHNLLIDEREKGTTVSTLERRPEQRHTNRDVPLSTAALLSARFPIISPPGNILNAKNQILSRIIDGGYFENYGATTAADIATQLKNICAEDASGTQECLDPFVIEITNDPEFLIPGVLILNAEDTESPEVSCANLDNDDPLSQENPALVDAEDQLWLSEIIAPISGLLGSRGAQGGLALLKLSKLGADNFEHVYVIPRYQPGPEGTCEAVGVSMSWWLSKQTQFYLDTQIDAQCQILDDAIRKLTNARGTPNAPPSDYCKRQKAQITP